MARSTWRPTPRPSATTTGGLTLNGTINIGNASGTTSGQLNFVGAQTLGYVADRFSRRRATRRPAMANPGALTIGGAWASRSRARTARSATTRPRASRSCPTPLINQGTIDDDVKGGAINVDRHQFGIPCGARGDERQEPWPEQHLERALAPSRPTAARSYPMAPGRTTAPITVSDSGTLALEGTGSLGGGATWGQSEERWYSRGRSIIREHPGPERPVAELPARARHDQGRCGGGGERGHADWHVQPVAPAAARSPG